jgi:hypothetical protein
LSVNCKDISHGYLGIFENPQITVAEKWTDKVDKTDGQKKRKQKGKTICG